MRYSKLNRLIQCFHTILNFPNMTVSRSWNFQFDVARHSRCGIRADFVATYAMQQRTDYERLAMPWLSSRSGILCHPVGHIWYCVDIWTMTIPVFYRWKLQFNWSPPYGGARFNGCSTSRIPGDNDVASPNKQQAKVSSLHTTQSRNHRYRCQYCKLSSCLPVRR
jgi:hypothetical protein